MTTLQDLIHILEDLALQYILGCIPVITPISATTYWLNSDRFKKDGKLISFRPFGHHAKEINLSD
ncbi:hypothetical protein RhiirC2_858942 [Rhizophagus irregularis]|uniref:Uncharacterized protein n=1 Tax=Rhizophagus irregularis TaxID=588596 RepID=A0A2N1M1X9_9GLOM|nr:hypothetical protein RhiirC2_858942 [Rhizophagus irregularis]